MITGGGPNIGSYGCILKYGLDGKNDMFYMVQLEKGNKVVVKTQHTQIDIGQLVSASSNVPESFDAPASAMPPGASHPSRCFRSQAGQVTGSCDKSQRHPGSTSVQMSGTPAPATQKTGRAPLAPWMPVASSNVPESFDAPY